jgi:N utilization substance protein A
MIQFVHRVERRTVEQKKAEAAAEKELVSAARADVPDAAFEADIATLNLPDHVYTILTEAEHRTVGNLMMAMKLNPDSVLSLAGIGPKAMQSIQAALAAVSYPEPEPPAEVLEVVSEAPVEEAVEAAPTTSQAEPVVEEAAPVMEEVTGTVTPVEETKEEEKDFDKIFSLQNVLAVPAAAEEETEEERNKKKEKKAKKGRELEFDEKRGEVVARKKHKRGDDDSVLEEWE